MNFNPRSREGSDRPALAGGRTNPISIHAPVKGATQACRYGLVAPGYFNPRSREGSDLILTVMHLMIMIFQSTLP